MISAPVMGKNSIKNQNKDLKIVSIFILLIYWSFMISAPVVSKNLIKNQKNDLKIVKFLN